MTIQVSTTNQAIEVSTSGQTVTANVSGGEGPVGPQGPQGPAGTTDYNELENVPAAFPPEAHAATHGAAGSDPVTVAQSQVESSMGTTDLAGDLEQLASLAANASNLASGTVPTARLATSGTASASTFLRGDQTWSAAPVSSVSGKTGAVTLAKGDVGLSNVDNTSDANKPISTATQSALDGKAAASHTHAAGDITSGTIADARLPADLVRSVDGVVSADEFQVNAPVYEDPSIVHAVSVYYDGDLAAAINADGSISGSWAGAAIPVANGGTGATDAATARSNLDAAASSHTHTQAQVDSTLGGNTLADDVSYLNTNKASTTHASHHATTGDDPIDPADIGAAPVSHSHDAGDITTGLIGISRIPTGATGTTVCIGNDSRLSNSRTPTAHKATHATGGSDALTAADIGAASSSHTHAASDIASGTVATARLASGTASSSTFLRGDQTWAAAPVTSVASKTGAVTLTASDVGAAPTASPTFTGVVTIPAGTVTAPGVSFASYAGTGISNPAANVFAISTNGSERLRVQADGKVAIGATSASDTLDVTGTAAFRGNGTVLKVIGGSSASATTNFQTDAFGGLVIDGGGSRVAVSSNGGNALLRGFNNSVILDHGYDNGATSHIRFSPGASEAARCIASSANGSLGPALLVGYTATQSTSTLYRLQVNSQIFATSSTIATSDGRYKENVAELTGALAIVEQLRPVEFTWKPHPIHRFPSGKTVGFIAQEVQAALAGTSYVNNVVKANYSAVATENEDGTVTQEAGEEFLGIAEGNLIAILAAAVKELSKKVAALEAAAS